jgi:hypothetical protein
MDYTRHGIHREVAFGNTPQQRFMGYWPSGEAIRELDVILPGQEFKPVALRHRPNAVPALRTQ